MKKRKVFIFVIAVLLLLVTVKEIFVLLYPDTLYIQYNTPGLKLVSWVAILMLASESDIFQTIYWRILLMLVAISIIGSLFRLQHWPGGTEIMLFVFTSAMITYIVRFIKKTPKTTMDVLKLLISISIFTDSIWHQYYYSGSVAEIIYYIFILVAYVYTAYNQFGKQKEKTQITSIQ